MTKKTIDLIDRLLLKACRESVEISGQDSKDALDILDARSQFFEKVERP
jgi:hypothetical protein